MSKELLALGLGVFLTGAVGVIFNRENIISILMSIELMMLGINLNLVLYSVFIDSIIGQVLAVWVLAVAAAESTVGLALLVSYYRVRGGIGILNLNLLAG